MNRPDFAIVGAPRAGTTSLARWLARQAGCAISDPKEPFTFVGDDLSNLRQEQGVSSIEEYKALFERGKRAGHKCGEASTLYLVSNGAIQRLIDFAPGIRIIILVRDPTDVVVSFFNQMRLMRYEDRGLEAAWCAAVDGRPPPLAFPDRLMADYPRIGSLGSQLRQAMEIAPAESILVETFDDLTQDTEAALRRIVQHGGLPAATDFTLDATNQSRVARGTLPEQLRSRRARAVTRRLKSALPGPVVERLRHSRDSLLYKPTDPVVAEGDVKAMIRDHFTSEVLLLEELIGRPLRRPQ